MKYQLFPALDAATEAALRSSIQQFGVVYPVVKDEEGNIIDGHHRARIADELGVDYPVIVRPNGAAENLAIDLNTARRGGDVEKRRKMAAEMRSDGHSTTTIARVLGVSDETVRRDLAASTYVEPDTVVGADGKRYPSTRQFYVGEPQPGKVLPEQMAELLADLEPGRSADEALPEAEAILDTTDDPAAGVVEAVESRRTPQAVPKKTSGDGIPPHPATYPQAVLDIFAEFVEQGDAVLDPFGGVGGIHQLRWMAGCATVAIELEAEWAAAHSDTIHGDATRLSELVGDQRFDVIATSPAYGNRLADDYQASDPRPRALAHRWQRRWNALRHERRIRSTPSRCVVAGRAPAPARRVVLAELQGLPALWRGHASDRLARWGAGGHGPSGDRRPHAACSRPAVHYGQAAVRTCRCVPQALREGGDVCRLTSRHSHRSRGASSRTPS
jgi:hypothetical protein